MPRTWKQRYKHYRDDLGFDPVTSFACSFPPLLADLLMLGTGAVLIWEMLS